MATQLSGPHCTRHNTDYSALKPCRGCLTDPGEPVDAEVLATVDPQDLADEKLARQCCAELLAIAHGQQERRDDNGSQDRIGAATVIKAYDGAAKWFGRFRELYERRKQLEHDNRLIAHDKEMAGLGRHH